MVIAISVAMLLGMRVTTPSIFIPFLATLSLQFRMTGTGVDQQGRVRAFAVAARAPSLGLRLARLLVLWLGAVGPARELLPLLLLLLLLV